MTLRKKHVGLIAGAAAGLLLAALVTLGLRTGPVDAQGLMAAPACQCSPVTQIAGLKSSLAHCLCGGVACVVNELGGTAAMQCVNARP